MRLLSTTTFEVVNFSYEAVPQQYAILSHIWGKEEDEISFRDVQEGRIKKAESRPTKIEGCCKIAKEDGYEYIWVDTCCIDSANSVELQEAINSMFRWYKNAAICYAYLSDIPADDKNPWDPNSEFSSSRWFERGWTLQELLAPPRLRFYNSEWHCYGTKGDLCALIEKATGIPSPHLLGVKPLRDCSVAQRMSWAAKRATKRPEDVAYCLLGIFGLSMTMIYGEGLKKAFRRLQGLIMEEIGDDSILAWGLAQAESTSPASAESVPGCILASSPADFAQCGHILARKRVTRDSFDMFGGSLRLHVPLFISAPDNIFGLLKCGDSGRVVGIPLENISNDASKEYVRPQGRHPMLVPEPVTEISPPPILVRIDHENRIITNGSRKYWFHVKGSGETGLELIDVEPRSFWRKDEALIEAALTFREDAEQRTFVQFRHKAGEAHDFLVILELRIEGSQSEVVGRCHVMTCDRDTSLGSVARNFSRIRAEAMGRQSASNGMISVQVIVEAESEGTMFFLRAVPLISPPEITYNATVELRILEAKMEINVLQGEESVTEREAAAMKEAVQKTQGNLNQTEEELVLVECELREMEARKAQLVMRLEEGCRVIDRLVHSQNATISCQDSLAKRRSSTQRRLELLSDKAIVNNLASDSNQTEGESNSPILNWAAEGGHPGVVRVLLDMGAADLELKSGDNESTPLHLAAKNGHHAIALMLLDHGAKIDAKDRFGETPLFDALRGKNEQVAHLLTEKGADINAKDRDDQTPLFNVVETKDEQGLRFLVEKGADLNAKDKKGETPLFSAVRGKNEQGLRFLVEAGADVNAKDKYGETPLFNVLRNADEEAFRLLVEKGAEIGMQGSDGRVPLHLAAKYNADFALRLFLEKGVDIEAKDGFSRTALHEAAEYGIHMTTSILLENDAAVDATNEDSQTPLHLASARGKEEISKLLIKNGANVNANNKNAETPLHVACKGGFLAVVGLLIQEGASIEAKTSSDDTSLNIAAKNGQAAIVELLVKKGASGASNGDGQSPLHLAALSGNEAILQTLLKSSTSVYLNQLTKEGRSALDCALENGHVGAAKLLLSHGALKSSERGNNTTIAGPSKTSGISVVASRQFTNGVVAREAVPREVPPLTFINQRHSTVSIFDKVLKRRKATRPMPLLDTPFPPYPDSHIG